MKDFKRKLNKFFAVGIFIPSLLIGCGGSNDSTTDDVDSQVNEVVNGTAAIGEAIAGGSVTAKCSDGSGFLSPVLTDSKGDFSGAVAEGALPCAIKVVSQDGSIILHSLALEAGITNITPITDMIIALASSEMPEDWFASDSIEYVLSSLEDATRTVLSSLKDAGFELPSENFDPFNHAFEINDPSDRLLDSIQVAIAGNANIDNYEDLLELISDGNISQFPLLPEIEDNSGEEEQTNTDTSDSASSCFVGIHETGTIINTVEEVKSYIDGAQVSTVTSHTSNEIIQGFENSDQMITDFFSETYDSNGVLSLTMETRAYHIKIDDSMTVAMTHSENQTQVFGENGYIVTSSVVFTPYSAMMPLDLSEGESINHSFTIDSEGTTNLQNTTVTYVGKEIVTVPAGTFTTCHFDIKWGFYLGDNLLENTTSHWLVEGSGIQVKLGSDDIISQLLSATINGVDL
jgi:hypothetical protein